MSHVLAFIAYMSHDAAYIAHTSHWLPPLGLIFLILGLQIFFLQKIRSEEGKKYQSRTNVSTLT